MFHVRGEERTSYLPGPQARGRHPSRKAYRDVELAIFPIHHHHDLYIYVNDLLNINNHRVQAV